MPVVVVRSVTAAVSPRNLELNCEAVGSVFLSELRLLGYTLSFASMWRREANVPSEPSGTGYRR
jgi:hypothetical protein